MTITGSREKPFADLASRLTSARIGSRLKQAELAAVLKCTQQSVSRWEAGTHRPSADQIPALAKAIGEDATDLMYLAGYGAAVTAGALPLIPVDALDPYTFERFVGDLLRALYPDAQVRQQGESGHKQEGSDLLLHRPDGTDWSFQCKRVERFGPADVRAAVEKHTVPVARAFLVLSRVASPQAAAVVRDHAGWTLWDKQDLAREFRTLAVEDQDRLVDIYFNGQRMALLGRSEPGPWLDAEQFFAPFRGRTSVFTHDWGLTGREKESAELKAALEARGDARVVLLVGQGGMGKSRLLKDGVEAFAAGHRKTKVRFLSAVNDPSRASLEDLGRGEKLLVVDDAHDREGLGVLIEYAADPRNKTRLLFATRPYAEARIASELALLGQVSPPTVRLERLGRPALRALIVQVLETFEGDPDWADIVLEASCDNPLVAAMAARVVARDALPMEMARHAGEIRTMVLARFADVVTGKLADASDVPLLRSVLEVIAAVQPIHIEDRRFAELYDKMRPGTEEADLTRALRILVDGGILYKRGHLYRLMPDLLGDFLIEKSCIGLDGKLSGFALALAEAVEGSQLTQLLVNLGRLDWRLANGTPSKSQLLQPIWRALEAIDTAYDDRIDAVRAVAIYQPAQALNFVQALLDGGRLPEMLGGILRRIALAPEHRLDALRLLWELGCDDARETSSNHDHPIRALAELIGYDEHKPLSFSEEAADFAFALFDDPGAWAHRHSPFELLEPLLSGQGMSTFSKGRSIAFQPYYINYDVVARLRQQVIDRALAALEAPDPAKAHGAAMFLDNALRQPHGAFNLTPGKALRAQYDAEFGVTIAAVASLVAAGGLAPTTLIGLARSLSWHAQYAGGDLQDAVVAIFGDFPQDLDFRLTAALSNGSDYSFLGQVPFAQWREDERWMSALVEEVRARYEDPSALCDMIIERLLALDAAHEGSDFNGLLFDALIKPDLALAREVIRRTRENPDMRIAFALGIALGALLAAEPVEGYALFTDLIASDNASLRRFAARALFSLKGGGNVAEDELLRLALQSDDPIVAATAAIALRSDRARDVRSAAALAMLIPFERYPQLFDEFGSLMSSQSQRLLKALQPGEVARLLERMRALPKLEGHWADEFLKFLALNHSEALAEFILDQSDTALREDRGIDFLGLRYSRSHRLGFEEASNSGAMLHRVWAWLRARDALDGYGAYAAGELFNVMFRVDTNPVVGFFDAMLDRAVPADLRWMARILRHTHHRFTLKYSDFVVRYLERCKAAGSEVADLAVDLLGAAAMSGMHSGTLGEPTRRDIEARDRSTEILASLSRLSPAYRLYKDILADAERDIAHSISQGIQLDEEDD